MSDVETAITAEVKDAFKGKLKTPVIRDLPKTTVEILIDRNKTHGDFNANARVSQELKQVIYNATIIHEDKPIPAYTRLNYSHREALDMICLKLSRAITGNPNVREHWVDLAGYATLIADMCQE